MKLGLSIFIMPSQPATPPRAVIGKVELDDDMDFDELEVEVERCPNCGGYHPEGKMVYWSADIGTWADIGDNTPLAQPLADRLTDRAKELGVKWD